MVIEPFAGLVAEPIRTPVGGVANNLADTLPKTSFAEPAIGTVGEWNTATAT